MTVTQRQDRRALHAAGDLEAVAARVAAAKDHITAEILTTDGQVGAQSFSDGGRSADTSSAVERVILARDGLFAERLGIDADLDEIIARIRHLYRACTRAIGLRVPPVEVPRCYSDPGLAGYLVPLGDGGWFDPLCTNLPRSKVGQCDACRKRLERWRVRNEQSPLADERPVEFESTVVDGQLGAVHARSRSAA
jgi:hypothetical protein